MRYGYNTVILPSKLLGIATASQLYLTGKIGEMIVGIPEYSWYSWYSWTGKLSCID
jgi:hypothetical protein